MRYPDDNEVLKMLSVRVRALRKEKNLTQSSLSALANIEKSLVQRIERGGSNITLKTMINLANGLDITLSELLNFPKADVKK